MPRTPLGSAPGARRVCRTEAGEIPVTTQLEAFQLARMLFAAFDQTGPYARDRRQGGLTPPAPLFIVRSERLRLQFEAAWAQQCACGGGSALPAFRDDRRRVRRACGRITSMDQESVGASLCPLALHKYLSIRSRTLTRASGPLNSERSRSWSILATWSASCHTSAGDACQISQ